MDTELKIPPQGSYYRHLGFQRNPFPVVPDAQDFFMTSSLNALVHEVLFALSERKGFVVITGEVGLGKSTLSRYLMHSFRKSDVSFALVLNTFLQEESLIEEVIRDFNLPPIEGSLQEKLTQLNEFLFAEAAEGRNCVLIIDDAQNLSVKSLEALRLLSNLETGSEKLIQILLIGQPELHQRLNSHDLRQLKSRINLTRSISSLSVEELKGYLAHKFNKVQDRKLTITSSAHRAIHTFTGGNLRRTNLLLDRILLSLVGRPGDELVINKVDIDKAILDIDPSTIKSKSMWPLFLIVGVVLAPMLAWGLLKTQPWFEKALASNTALDSVALQADSEVIEQTPDMKQRIELASEPSDAITEETVQPDSDPLAEHLADIQLSELTPKLTELLHGGIASLQFYLYNGVAISVVPKSMIMNASILPSVPLDTYGHSAHAMFLWKPLFQGGTLSWGAHSEHTSAIQKLLAHYGYYQAKIDGVAGTATLGALTSFQRDIGLQATGVLDNVTLLALHYPEIFSNKLLLVNAE